MSFTGVFPVHNLDVQIAPTKDTFVPIADMETATITIETGVETWTPLSEGGWQRALATAKSMKIAMKGKRNIGDPGNDYVASCAFKNGRDCDSQMKIGFPDGAELTCPVVVGVTDFIGGDSTNVAPLAFDLTSNGKPDYKEATT